MPIEGNQYSAPTPPYRTRKVSNIGCGQRVCTINSFLCYAKPRYGSQSRGAAFLVSRSDLGAIRASQRTLGGVRQCSRHL